MKLNILPVPIFLHLVDLLFLSSVLCGIYDTDFARYFKFNQKPTRTLNDLFILPKCTTVASCSHFFYRTQRTVINLPADINFLDPAPLKSRLLKHMFKKVEQYQENVQCTRRLSCDCHICRNIRVDSTL